MNQKLFEKYVCNQSSHSEKYDGAAHPSYRLKLKYPLPFSVSYVQLVTQQYESKPFEKHLCIIKVATIKNMDDFHYAKEAIICNHQIKMLFAVNKDEWNTKEDTGKSLKNALDVLQYHLSG